jgi:hypothetical protein
VLLVTRWRWKLKNLMLKTVATVVACLLASTIPSTTDSNYLWAQSPAYAQPGAFASYTALGGFIPFFGGVSGDATYTVLQVFDNGTMEVFLNENISQGELGQTTNTTYQAHVLDSILSPGLFPAIAPSLLGSSNLTVQGITCSLSKQMTVTVPAGTFFTYEYVGRDLNGTTDYYWFDPSSGLVIEMSSGVSALELVNSNIAYPSSVQQPAQAESPYILAVLIAWAMIGAVYLWIRRHYQRAAKARVNLLSELGRFQKLDVVLGVRVREQDQSEHSYSEYGEQTEDKIVEAKFAEGRRGCKDKHRTVKSPSVLLKSCLPCLSWRKLTWGSQAMWNT